MVILQLIGMIQKIDLNITLASFPERELSPTFSDGLLDANKRMYQCIC
jgi:hypothetical protein